MQTEIAFSDTTYLTEQVITCIGNKRSLLGFLGNGVEAVKKRLDRDRLRILDVFSGSGVVARFLKRSSSYLHANDFELYSKVTNDCYLSNASEVDTDSVAAAIRQVNRRAVENPSPGFIAELYAPEDDHAIRAGERVFYTRRNAVFLDTARKLIDDLDDSVKPYLLAPLIYEASVHTNTAGVFKGFYKNSRTGVGQFGGNGKDALARILADIHIPFPVFSNFDTEYRVTQEDANELVRTPGDFDLAYVDPPYNQHPYGSNYFMLNLLASYQRPGNISRVAGIPADWKRSRYNKKARIHAALDDLIAHLNASHVLVSYNSEGFISRQEMLSLLSRYGAVDSISREYNAFRGSRNLHGRDRYVKEYLFLLEKR